MAGLILRLRPFEELLINGVLVQNGDRKANLRVKTDGAAILRVRDAMRPDEATTPERRAYYVAQLAVAGEMSAADATAILAAALKQLAALHHGRTETETIARARDELEAGRLYSVMRRLRDLIDCDAPDRKAS
jgi:flagellar protein FlbT